MPNIAPTELFPTRREVSNANMTRLNALPRSVHIFNSHDTFPNSPGSTMPKRDSAKVSSTGVHHPPANPASESNKRDGLLAGIMAEKTLQLKEGAQVMLVKNVDEMLVNGCVGQVVGFHGYREVISTLRGEREKRAGPAKTTGFVRNVVIEASGVIGAKDRPSNKENVDKDAATTKDVKEKKKSLPSQTMEELFPLVEFPTPEGGKEAVLVMRDEFRVEDFEGKVLARRMQVSVHTHRRE